MLAKGDLSKVGEIVLALLRREILPRLEFIEREVVQIKLAVQSLEFRLADARDEIDAIAATVNRIERRLDATNIQELPDEDGGPWLPPFHPSGT